MATETEDLLTVREAARICGRTSETVRRWIWDGKLPARKLGNQLFVRRSDLSRFRSRREMRQRSDRLALLSEIDAQREAIRRRIGGDLDVLDALERSREAHP